MKAQSTTSQSSTRLADSRNIRAKLKQLEYNLQCAMDLYYCKKLSLKDIGFVFDTDEVGAAFMIANAKNQLREM